MRVASPHVRLLLLGVWTPLHFVNANQCDGCRFARPHLKIRQFVLNLAGACSSLIRNRTWLQQNNVNGLVIMQSEAFFARRRLRGLQLR